MRRPRRLHSAVYLLSLPRQAIRATCLSGWFHRRRPDRHEISSVWIPAPSNQIGPRFNLQRPVPGEAEPLWWNGLHIHTRFTCMVDYDSAGEDTALLLFSNVGYVQLDHRFKQRGTSERGCLPGTNKNRHKPYGWKSVDTLGRDTLFSFFSIRLFNSLNFNSRFLQFTKRRYCCTLCPHSYSLHCLA